MGGRDTSRRWDAAAAHAAHSDIPAACTTHSYPRGLRRADRLGGSLVERPGAVARLPAEPGRGARTRPPPRALEYQRGLKGQDFRIRHPSWGLLTCQSHAGVRARRASGVSLSSFSPSNHGGLARTVSTLQHWALSSLQNFGENIAMIGGGAFVFAGRRAMADRQAVRAGSISRAPTERIRR